MGSVNESVVYEHEEVQWTHLGALKNPTCQLLDSGGVLVADDLPPPRKEVGGPRY